MVSYHDLEGFKLRYMNIHEGAWCDRYIFIKGLKQRRIRHRTRATGWQSPGLGSLQSRGSERSAASFLRFQLICWLSGLKSEKQLKKVLHANLYFWNRTGSLCNWYTVSWVQLSPWPGYNCWFSLSFVPLKSLIPKVCSSTRARIVLDPKMTSA